MQRSSKRGKIPQRDWPLIIKRYEAGETLASIARTYDCSPPAISYILSRNRMREGSMEELTELSAPVLVKEPASTVVEVAAPQGKTETPDAAAPANGEAQTTDPVDGSGRAPQGKPIPAMSIPPEPAAGPILAADGKNGPSQVPDDVSRATVLSDGPRSSEVPQNGEARRTLHLSLAQEGVHRSGMRPGGDDQPVVLPQPGRARGDFPASADGRQTFPNALQPQKEKAGAASIDRALRERVDEDIAAFLAAFDAALAQDSVESRAGLREATDRLLRAGARTRIELERLEARIPLSTREDRHPAPAWRPR